MKNYKTWMWKLFAVNCALNLAAAGLFMLVSWKLMVFQLALAAVMFFASYATKPRKSPHPFTI